MSTSWTPTPAARWSWPGHRGVTYPLLADPGGELQDEAEFRECRGMPTRYFVDAEGEVAFAQPGVIESMDELLDLVREHLGVDLHHRSTL